MIVYFFFGVGVIVNEMSCYVWVVCGSCMVYRYFKLISGWIDFFVGVF